MDKDKHWLSNEITILAGSAFFREENEPVVNVIELRKLVEQLDEPKLPVIPQFVADWIERSKQKGYKLIGVMLYFYVLGIDSDDTNKYIKENYETFVRAWLDGYTIEKEPKYVVAIDCFYFKYAGESDEGDFEVSITKDIKKAHVFENEKAAKNIETNIGGVVRKVEEVTQ